MEHPLISDQNQLSDDELHDRITDLTRKLNIAMQHGNGFLCNQIRMALETYRSEYQKRLNSKNGDSPDFSDKINIE